jgi:hypothetical protein
MQYVKIGQKVRITFEGRTKNKKNQQVNLFKVEVAKTPYTSKSSRKRASSIDLEKKRMGCRIFALLNRSL